MTTKIFITPWIELTDDEIRKCIRAGADSARIHTGKLTADRINTLIYLYDLEQFKFYLDLRGNKASINRIDQDLQEELLELGQRVLVYAYNGTEKAYFAPWKKRAFEFRHCLGMNFLPQAVITPVKGNFAIDDGKVLIRIDKLVSAGHLKNVYLECTVIKAGKVFPGDGVSSTDIFIHSCNSDPFSEQDIAIMKKIPLAQKLKIKYFAVSFVETAEHITAAQQVLYSLGFKSSQIVPKVETIKGIENLAGICARLVKDYGTKAEVQIGRGDLCLDCGRMNPAPDYHQLVEQAISICKKSGVQTSILALVMQSVRQRCKLDRSSENMQPDKEELENILCLRDLGVYQIGLTNDMYIDRPERMIRKLKRLLRPGFTQNTNS